MRKLASIQLINNILPIEGSDFIEQIQVLGWTLVSKKGEFNINDKCIYIEIDSVVKEFPEFEFLRKYKFRVKTQKIRGVISQGLALPLKSFNISENTNIGDDMTESLGITKYLTPSEREEINQNEIRIKNDKNKLRKFLMRYSWFRRLFLSRTQKEGFPYWVSKTDEERIQNIRHVLEQFKDCEVYVTEKIDYQSGTWTGKMISNPIPLIGKILPKKFKFIVCSRNLTTNNKTTLYWKIAKKYNIEDILKLNPNLTIQGEQGDTKVQGNKYGIKEPTMWVFNIIDHVTGKFYNYSEIVEFCDKWGLQPVPLIKTCKLSDLGSTVHDLVEFSKGKSVLNPKVDREGVVIRCVKDAKKLLSFKVISPDFLLKYED
ncbi:MAG: RNA ligase family protein [Bacteroidota bacterium]